MALPGGADARPNCRVEAAGLRIDWSRQFLDEHSRGVLLSLAAEAGFHEARRKLFNGERVNESEQRAAMHMALRGAGERDWQVEGEVVSTQVRAELERIENFVAALRDDDRLGATGKPFRNVVNIGIGGSHLGPEVVTQALPAAEGAPRVHFLSNVDPAQYHRVMDELDPETTLLVVVSKTFTSRETMVNARRAREWLVAALGENAVADHFVAVSANVRRVNEFGIDETRLFRFWDWVGGRFSVWSAAGLAAAIHLGMPRFREMLAGAAAMDRHFLEAEDAVNAPLMLGLLDVQSIRAFGWSAWAVVPYSDRLRLLPAYLQQLVMESNGKGANQRGQMIEGQTGPVLLGGTGTDAQHAFFQMLHQGPLPVPVDFIASACPQGESTADWEGHRILLSNCLAQAEALATGKSPEQVEAELRQQGMDTDTIRRLVPQKSFKGNRPSTLVLMDRLSPVRLGALIALYEHRVFVQALLFGINPFDQMGVELGKTLAGRMESVLADADALAEDPIAEAAAQWIRSHWEPPS
ncbi:glucose-6-phosphate isomerase [Gammaproteobacteria bacterium AB-CW1]|uniref:Glucose-6-phosphate isomerase n=1 Tax=Natronospira elongata TaxID=3110268 RepID=A0AAP6JFV9_9GAMM|nr:glucose-6-phosphate isomerase [Gammaproteobacteria bacterium AB-CW1]